MNMAFKNEDKNILILRGVPGSGKSTFCDLIAEPKTICCADDYHMKGGVYCFAVEAMGRAHKHCRDTFDTALADPAIKNIIVANTNIKPKDWKYYLDKAKEAGIMVSFAIMENRHGGVNQHGVPEAVLARHEEGLKNNLQFRYNE